LKFSIAESFNFAYIDIYACK